MHTWPGKYTEIEQNIAANVRTYRESAGISQEELAQRMAGVGFGFTQATIWKIESGQRPVKASELEALADCLGKLVTTRDLTSDPEDGRLVARLQHATDGAYTAYTALKKAAADYLKAQHYLVFAAREAHDGGVIVTEFFTDWLNMPPEEVVAESRVESELSDEQRDQRAADVSQRLDAMRAAGYDMALRIEDVEYSGGGSLSVWTPPAAAHSDSEAT